MDSSGSPWASVGTPSSRPASRKSTRSSRSAQSRHSSRTTEQTPLLQDQEEPRSGHTVNESQTSLLDEDGEPATATSLLRRSLSDPSRSDKKPWFRKRWPSILALLVLCVLVILIMLGFFISEGVQEYAMQAANFRPTNLSLDGLTDHGAKIRIEGDFRMDASRVHKQSVRNIGRFGTWIAREAETGPADVDVYLPEYGNVLIGKARVPGIKVNVRNGHTTHVAFVTSVEPGSTDGIRNVANDWIEGRLGQIRLKGKAQIPIRSGLINVGKQTIEQSMVFEGHDAPALPHYNITKLNIREAKDGRSGMGADATIVVSNDFPVQISLPPVAVDVLIGGCRESDRRIMLGTAETAQLEVQPRTDITVNVTGNVEKLPDALTAVCPNSAKSPLDAFLGDYIKGEDATIYINCCNFPDPSTPSWAHDLLKDITVPVPFAGRSMGNLIKNFSLADVHFYLPEPFANPGTPEAAPKISAVVKVDIGLPNEMNFPLDVNQVKADADIFYHKKKLGKMNLKKWQHANSTRVQGHGNKESSLLVQSDIKKAPIEILDDDLFSEVVQALIFKGDSIMMDIEAAVSVGVDTPMGKFAVRSIPAQGVVPIKPIHGGSGNDSDAGSGLGSIETQVGSLAIVNTSATSITIEAHINMTNPTNYSATIPFFSINILANDTVLGQAIARDLVVGPGNNTDKVVSAVWDPLTNGGKKGRKIGSELLSQYISGYNTTLTIQAHNGTIPAQPALGALLSHFPITVSAPHLSNPDDDDNPSDPDDPQDPDDPDDTPKDPSKSKGPHFIRGATMHIISSTAIFTLASPFATTTMYITHLNATSYYEGHTAGTILYDFPFPVPPGLSDSPRLPVAWSLGSMGYEAIRKALGGELKLSAFAHVGVQIGEWNERIWYRGGQIGAKVRL